MTVKRILARKGNDVVTIAPTATLTAAVKLLADHRIGALVVIGTERRIVGMVSERDIVRVLAEHGEHALVMKVAAVMTRTVTTCTDDETTNKLMERMTAGKFRRIPVVEQGRLAGIVSIGDVVKSRVEDMEREATALQDYIRTA